VLRHLGLVEGHRRGEVAAAEAEEEIPATVHRRRPVVWLPELLHRVVEHSVPQAIITEEPEGIVTAHVQGRVPVRGPRVIPDLPAPGVRRGLELDRLTVVVQLRVRVGAPEEEEAEAEETTHHPQ